LDSTAFFASVSPWLPFFWLSCLSSAERFRSSANPVEDSTEGRRISEAVMDYWVAFLRTGKPRAENLPVWPAFASSAPQAMVFGNSGIEARGFHSS
jgi:carboxylesterase type B